MYNRDVSHVKETFTRYESRVPGLRDEAKPGPVQVFKMINSKKVWLRTEKGK